MVTHIHVCQQLDKPFKLWKSEIYCTIAQVKLWKKLYGWPTKLYCDSNTIKIFQSLGIIDIWDSVDTELLDSQNQIDKTRFWSSGKLLVMQAQKSPYMMSDLDFVNFTNMFDYNFFNGYDLGVYHTEDRYATNAYKNPRTKLREVGLRPPRFMWWHADPFNMGTFFMNDMQLNKEYTTFSLEYISRASKLESPKFTNNQYTVFAEQQVLAAMVKWRGYKVAKLLNATYTDGFKWKESTGLWDINEERDHAIHLWLNKYNFAYTKDEDWYIYTIMTKLKEIDEKAHDWIMDVITEDNLDNNKQFLK